MKQKLHKTNIFQNFAFYDVMAAILGLRNIVKIVLRFETDVQTLFSWQKLLKVIQ